MTTKQAKRLSALAVGTTSLLFAAVASAQPAPIPAPDPQPAATQPAPVPAPPAPAPVYQPAAPAPAPVYTAPPTPTPAPTPIAEEVPDAPVTARPTGMTFGLGMSLFLNGSLENKAGTDLFTPTGASVRVRLASGMTLEPFVRLATSGQSQQDGDIKNAQNEVLLGSNVRLPLKSRGKVDLVGIGTGLVSFQQNDPDGDDNNNSITRFALAYGVGVNYWYNSNWCISFDATNPLFSFESRSQEVSSDATETDINIGAIWDPTTSLSVHLFY